METINLNINLSVIPTASSINIESLSGQNKRLLLFLLQGEKITCLDQKKQDLGIGYLNSRIADLRRFLRYENCKIESKMIKINNTSVKQYWIEAINN